MGRDWTSGSCALDLDLDPVALWDFYQLEANVHRLEGGANNDFHRVSIAVLCLFV